MPSNIIVAIWGRESGFGRAKLPYPVVDGLAINTYMSTRKEIFRQGLDEDGNYADIRKSFPDNDMTANGMILVPAGRHGPELMVTPNF